MTELEFLTDLESRYKSVSPNPSNVNGESEDDKGVTWRTVNVFEVDLSLENKKDVGYRRNIFYYVYNKDQVFDPGNPEEVFYHEDEDHPKLVKDVSTVTYEATPIFKIYNNGKLRTQMIGAILKTIEAIFDGDSGYSGDDAAKRLNWAKLCHNNPALHLNAFMAAMAKNGTIRTKGGTAPDADVEFVCSSAILGICNREGILP